MKEYIQNLIIDSIKNRDLLTLSVLRLVKSKIEIKKKNNDLEILESLSNEFSKLSKNSFKYGNYEDGAIEHTKSLIIKNLLKCNYTQMGVYEF